VRDTKHSQRPAQLADLETLQRMSLMHIDLLRIGSDVLHKGDAEQRERANSASLNLARAASYIKKAARTIQGVRP
jgi:hypothetical protein